ncbi:malate dehydrogenase [Candidatus Aerophobetes bacterium]|uniref:Malate dehydrogenase n=1 Tax=Aerophobetes bacterium TaxID=2030807 RepID=A0A497E3I1_UNCAE|nr:MAG: malate dehydrogenase [Candidatus Aerophobetes bacterium]
MEEEKLLARAKEPERLAMRYHPFYRGKLATSLKAPIRTYEDLSIWYTPGVAGPCKAICKDEGKVFEYTNKGNFVAIVSDGSRVLGLGDIGPEAALPVMEGKAMIFKYLGGVDAFPICLDTKDPDEIITAVRWLAPTFGGINLEDIAKPKCFYILERLREELDIPVWHDDQQGTALVTLSALISALKVVGKRLEDVEIALIGAGAANISIARYIMLAGANPDSIVMVDRGGILHEGRMDLKDKEPVKWEMCRRTNKKGKRGGIREALKGADVCIALSRSGPGVIKKEWVSDMAEEAIVFACANPVPEIWPWEAKEAGARIVATGRSDFPNQVNNSLGFPAVFRGALDVGARKITDEMCIAASYAISEYTEEKGLSEEYIIPNMGEAEMYIREAVAVGMKAIQQGVARMRKSPQELRESASSMIKNAHKVLKLHMEEGIISPLPGL